MRVLFIIPAPLGISPGQRFRFEHYLPDLQKEKIEYKIAPFYTLEQWSNIYVRGGTLKKVRAIFMGCLKRIYLFFIINKYDYLYLYREMLPFGPPVFEWICARLFRKKIIYDFDDAIWIPTSSEANPIASKIKCSWKVAKICKWSHVVSVGNTFLASYAKQYNKNVVIISTVVDTENVHNRSKNHFEKPLTIGWTGTFTNFFHLNLVKNAISRIQQQYRDIEFLIIADTFPKVDGVSYRFIKWNKETEIEDLLKISVGIMPLYNTDVQLGKCAFKAIQYMSLGIPAVVSPVGANCEVVSNGVNGYWADSEEEWYENLLKLLLNAELREEMGVKAKNTIIKEYSVAATKEKFIQIFSEAVPNNNR